VHHAGSGRPERNEEARVRLFEAGQRQGAPVVVHDRILTAANGITLVRLLGLPLFVYLMVELAAYGQAFAVLTAVGTTDWVDGYVARRFDQVTRLGQMIDPLIDRALLATAGVTLWLVGFLPLWILMLIVGRDVILFAAAGLLFRGPPPIPVNRTGKFATANLLIGIPGFLLGRMDWAGATEFRIAAWGFTAVGIAAYYAAGVQYAAAARRAWKGSSIPPT
jgi:cardiolipin synthase